jgi:hypothetical protein
MCFRHARLGALDLAGVQLLQTLFDAAQIHGAEVRLALVTAPAYWNGPTFTRDSEVAVLLDAQAGRGGRSASCLSPEWPAAGKYFELLSALEAAAEG